MGPRISRPSPRGGGGICLVDDKDGSFEQKLAEIKCGIASKEAKLLLSSYKYEHVLLQKLKALGVEECYDGIGFAAGQLNAHFKAKYQNQKLIAIALSGYEIAQKHLGLIPLYLKQAGLNIIYIISFASLWADELKAKLKATKEDYIFADFEFLEALDFFPFILEQTSYLRINRNVRSLKLHTSADMIQNFAYLDREVESSLGLCFFLCSFLNVHSQSHLEYLQQKQQFYGIDPNPSTRFVCGGYPSIDKEIESFELKEVERDTIIFVSTHLNFFDPSRLGAIIQKCLKDGFRVVFKSNPAHKELCREENAFVAPFLGEPNFVFYDNSTPRLPIQELHRSLCLVESCSSMLYSYPLITKRPAIVLYPSKKESQQKMPDGFYQSKIHIQIFLEDDHTLSSIAKGLKDKETQRKWQQSIQSYCQQDWFCIGEASKVLSEFIIDWYANREILKML